MTTQERAAIWMDHGAGRVTALGAIGLGGVLLSSAGYLFGLLPVALYAPCVVAALLAYGIALALAHLGDPERSRRRDARR